MATTIVKTEANMFSISAIYSMSVSLSSSDTLSTFNHAYDFLILANFTLNVNLILKKFEKKKEFTRAPKKRPSKS